MNRAQLSIASDCLRAIKNDDGCVRHPITGICDAISTYFDHTHEIGDTRVVIQRLLKMLMLKWPLSSGSKAFPVPNPDKVGEKAAQHIYMFSADLWVGPYGELRLNLLDWLIDQVESIPSEDE